MEFLGHCEFTDKDEYKILSFSAPDLLGSGGLGGLNQKSSRFSAMHDLTIPVKAMRRL